MSKDRKKLAVLISGRGSNMEAILAASQNAAYPAQIVLVLSDKPDAKGLETAQSAEIDTAAFSRDNYSGKAEHEADIINAIENAQADFIILAGYMRILSKEFTSRFEGRLINIHPSLLPAYKGLDTHARVLEDRVTEHGCTVHFVNHEMDGGAIIAQATVAVAQDDTEASLAGRVLKQEHRLYPEVIRLLASGSIYWAEGKTGFTSDAIDALGAFDKTAAN